MAVALDQGALSRRGRTVNVKTESEATRDWVHVTATKNGLILSENKKDHIESFSYSLLHNMSSSPVDWYPLAGQDERFKSVPSICVHKLNKDDNLTELLERFGGHAKAIVLINIDDEHVLNDKINSTIAEVPVKQVPILIVKKSDGDKILSYLQKDRSIYACVKAESQVDESKKTKELNVKLIRGTSEPVKVLFNTLEQLIFALKLPVAVSNSSERFLSVISAFHRFTEETAEKLAIHSSGFECVIQLLQHHRKVCFNSDFLLYIYLMHHMHVMKYDKIRSSAVHAFQVETLELLEKKMSPKDIANYLNEFLKQGDFSFVDDKKIKKKSIFEFLEKACLELADFSAEKRRGAASKPIYSNFVYSRILWVSMSLKFHQSRSTQATRKDRGKWRDVLLKESEHIVFDDKTIDNLTKALELGRYLKLPFDYACTQEHLSDLLVAKIRPFTQMKKWLAKVEVYISSSDDLIEMMKEVRGVYKDHFNEDGKAKLENVGGTLHKCLKEGIAFVEEMYSIFLIKHQLPQEDITSVVFPWLQLLLEQIDILSSDPHTHYKLFLSGKEPVIKKYFKELKNHVVSAAKEEFCKFSIQQFLQLYKSVNNVWSREFLHDFLKNYVIPSDIELSDPTWKDFFNTVVKLFQSAREHDFLAEFLIKVARKYYEYGRAVSFLLDLLSLCVSELLSANDHDQESRVVREDFTNFLRAYIKKNALQLDLCSKLTRNFIIDKTDGFQQVLLDMLCHEIVPPGLKCENNDSFYTLLDCSVNDLYQSVRWCQHLRPIEKFYWGVLTTCCLTITVSKDNFDWVEDYCCISSKMSRRGLFLPFSAYCTSVELTVGAMFPDQTFGAASGDICCTPKNLDMGAKVPDQILQHSSEDVRRYFGWIKSILDILLYWKDKVSHQFSDNSYDEILQCANNCTSLKTIWVALHANSLQLNFQCIEDFKRVFLNFYDRLNRLLLYSIPGQDSEWYTLSDLVLKWGLSLSPDDQKFLQTKVIFPNPKHCYLPTKQLCSISLPTSDFFVRLVKSVTLRELERHVLSIEASLKPIAGHLLRVLAFFKSESSYLFKFYLSYYLNEAKASCQVCQSDTLLFTSSLSKSLTAQPQHAEILTMEVFADALKLTESMVNKIVQGKAEYSEIVMEGNLKLEELEIEKEFNILSKYASVFDVPKSDSNDIESMLVLFQYTTHIKSIISVCQQYHLEKCLQDPLLQDELTKVMKHYTSEEDRSKADPCEAREKMKKVKEILYQADTSCLSIFKAVADSAEFYQFIKDRQFCGQSGMDTFLQQYQLVTAQLQHEEYDEQVLNHLLAAFKVISPFMDTEKKFDELMQEVSALDAVNGLRQLETVNANITLIRLWFSRAEGETLQNVASELESIIQTGSYIIFLGKANKTGHILLEYDPAATAQSPTSSSHSRKDGHPADVYAESLGRIQRNQEQIGDFVRKLGFLDKDKDEEGGLKIKSFIHLNQTVNKLFNLYLKLRELGHPSYLSEGKVPISCSKPREEVNAMVQVKQQEVANWGSQMAEVRINYPWLLFFNIPRMLQLYNLIQPVPNEHYELDEIVHEFSFLIVNQPEEIAKFKEKVQQVLCEMKAKARNEVEDVRDDVETANYHNSRIHVVGKFLDELMAKHTLPHTCGDSKSARHRSITAYFAHPLYCCPDYSQIDFLCLILGIFSGVPEPHQIFRCQLTTTKEDLDLFLKRVERYHLHYLMLAVNKLPSKLQEYLVQHYQLKGGHLSNQDVTSTTHFVETAPSLLREMPWTEIKSYKDYRLSMEEGKKICSSRTQTRDVSFQIVYGSAGNGKTYYVKSKLDNCNEQLTIAINEAFSRLTVITMLRSLPLYANNVGIFFNFTLLPPGGKVTDKEKLCYKTLMELVSWLFFDLFILGCAEDPSTGLSFTMPGGLQWAIYIEVPSREGISPEEALECFLDEIPPLRLIGTPHYIKPDIPFSVDSDVQLVCKYLRAYKAQLEGNFEFGIDRKHVDEDTIIKFSLEDDLECEECHALLQEFMPEHVTSTKITQQLFIRYMKRRCEFLDRLPYFNYNQGAGIEFGATPRTRERVDYEHLGSTLMKTMLDEVNDFCDPAIKENWSLKPHQQLIYDGDASLDLISLRPEDLTEEEKDKFKKIGVKIRSANDLRSREVLDNYLSRAFNVQLEQKRLTAIDDSAYVLTLDYTLKMLNIHERYKCGVPVIIEGETGVGKTALIEMISKLWNQSLLFQWKKNSNWVLEFFQEKLSTVPSALINEKYTACLKAIEAICLDDVSIDSLLLLCDYTHGTCKDLYSQLGTALLPMRNDPILPLLIVKKPCVDSLDHLFDEAEKKQGLEATAALLQGILLADVKPAFHKVNVHAALTTSDVEKLLEPAFSQAEVMQNAYQQRLQSVKGKETVLTTDFITNVATIADSSSIHSSTTDLSTATNSSSSIVCSPSASATTTADFPFVTVFLDEVNTSSCLGLFKEIIIDRSFNGKPIPKNIFIVAACNPHRGNSLASHLESSEETWLRTTYYVRPLHPTLKFLMWDYGSLDESQEKDYVKAKLKMIERNSKMPEFKVGKLKDLIVESQTKMRMFAKEQLKKITRDFQFIHNSSRNCVSQRDIQRVFTFYQWFKSMYEKKRSYADCHRRAVLVSLGLVYYMRLNTEYRKKYEEYLNDCFCGAGEVSFIEAFQDELNYFIGKVQLPRGIARTLALKENLFAIIICTVTHTPLIIVGAPGSSKTLSFNQAIANLKGQESKVSLFRDTDIFRALDPHYYQCSRRTTSNEIETVFSRAITRQRSHQDFHMPIYCVVFMDEAGLPEESRESLKVLHYHLDQQVVSFVAITNHLLDAAKTNRAISLFRPEACDSKDLQILAKGCLHSSSEPTTEDVGGDMKMIIKFCEPYSKCMKDPKFSKFFGLRDFIHFVTYFRRRRDEGQALSPELVMQALERNFNGSGEFETICMKFFKAWGVEDFQQHQNLILDVLKDSMQDRPLATQDLTDNEVRYKLIIDPSEDDSLVRLLFTVGVMDRKKTRLFMCSDFPDDSEAQKIDTIAAIRHSAIEGHTVIMSQTDAIHESFYDLFNQRFRCIHDPEKGARYYTNIAIGAHHKPSRVDPKFQCVVVIKKSEVETTPAPFLNRFEKYTISHRSLLEAVMKDLRPNITTLVKAARYQVEKFLSIVHGDKSLYGLQPDTLDSLILELLPFGKTSEHQNTEVNDASDIHVYIYQEILNGLRNYAGFYIPMFDVDELKSDCSHIFDLTKYCSTLEGLPPNLTQEKAKHAVEVAFNFLLSSQTHQSPDLMQIVIFVLQQIIVLLLMKRLMNLMTTEAIILHRSKIPCFYLEHYLEKQAHFSIKQTIDKYHGSLRATLKDPSQSPNKLVCYTRSSALLGDLPAQFPCLSLKGSNLDAVRTMLTVRIFDQIDKMVMYKLSSLRSQSSVEELLKDFVSSDMEVCILLANMQETSRKTISHVRIMIEEAELKTSGQSCCKMFVLVLHFPPPLFFQHCYPALFLKGWDHTYLDTLAHNDGSGLVDIHNWFLKCCFPSRLLACDNSDALFTKLFPQAVSKISARLCFCSNSDRSADLFNSNMNGAQRSKALRELLCSKGLGKVLCDKFYTYWTPKVMEENLERAATFSHQRESTLSITDTIQAKVKTLFEDFCVYMLTQANESFNLDILYSEDVSSPSSELFIALFDSFPMPELSQLSLLSKNLQVMRPPAYCPQFPFFTRINAIMEKIIESSYRAANMQMDIFADNDEYSPTEEDSKLQALINAVINDLKENAHQMLTIATSAMDSHPQLWHCYFNDFITDKLGLVDQGSYSSSKQGDFAQQILHSYFMRLHSTELEASRRVAELHCYVNIHQLHLAQMATILRPLSRIEEMQISESTSQQLLIAVQKGNDPLGHGSPAHLSDFIITTLFDSLRKAASAAATQNLIPASWASPLILWFNSYRDVMSILNLKKVVYHSLHYVTGCDHKRLLTLEAKFNLMHATFVVLQSSTSLETDEKTLSQGLHVFRKLLLHHLNEDASTVELKSHKICPFLTEVIEVVIAELSSHEAVRLPVESLLVHFFSPFRRSYHKQDALWFLNNANEQWHWCVHLPFEGREEEAQEQLGVVRELVELMEGEEGEAECIKEEAENGEIIDNNEGRDTEDGRNEQQQLPDRTLEMGVYTLYLGRILGTYSKQLSTANDFKLGPLGLYQPQFRNLVGEVLVQNKNFGLPGPYVPLFYHEVVEGVSQSKRMQQPLCHLYFLCVMEHLTSSKKYSTQSYIIETAVSIQNQLETAVDGEAVLLWIELQAVIQVLLHELASHLNPLDASKLCDILHDDINRILEKTTMGTNLSLGHGMVLSMNIIKLLKSSRKFGSLITEKFDTMDLMKIDCLKPIHRRLEKPSDMKSYLFPFLRPESDGELAKLYVFVKDTMLNIHCHPIREYEVFLEMAEKCVAGDDFNLRDAHSAFRMVLWLVTYYDFYDKQIVSPLLCNIVGSQEVSKYLLVEGYVLLIQCFLQPKLMLLSPESPNSLVEQQVLDYAPDGTLHTLHRNQGTKVDPIHQLFDPNKKLDQSDIDLRHSLANLMAVVLGNPPRSNHLWFHMFAPDELKGTYMTGFMYDAKIRPDGLMYDCGVELSPEGQYGRQDYRKHACRGTYTLHSLYLLLWANFGCFCMALLTQPHSNERIHGNVISEWLSLRHYCMSQLRTLWMHIQNNLQLSEEQRSFFIMRVLDKFSQVLSESTSASKGTFSTREELDAYEKSWHTNVYEPTRNEQENKFIEFSSQQEHDLFSDIRELEKCYPHFPSEQELTHCILSSGDLQKHSEGGELRFLTKLVAEHPQLYSGGALLPDLVELYQWLHTHLAHLITYKDASCISIGKVIKLSEENSKALAIHIKDLYERVMQKYNKYVELIGGAIGAGACAAVRRRNKIFTISDEIPILHFLSDTEVEGQGNDWLYVVIADIITNHNDVVQNAYSILRANNHMNIGRFLPEEPARIMPAEINLGSVIFSHNIELHGISSFVQLLRSRYKHTYCGKFNALLSHQAPLIHLKQLEEDFVSLFIAGKPFIESPEKIRKVYKFKEEDCPDCDSDEYALQELTKLLPDTFKEPISDKLRKRFEYEFHSASYDIITEVLSALRVIVANLSKALQECRGGDLDKINALEFIKTYYEDLHDQEEVLREIGIQGATTAHLKCLESLPLVATYSCFEFFYNYAKEGHYDFIAVPYRFKAQLSDQDQSTLEQIRTTWPSTTNELLKELQQLVDALKHSERNIINHTSEEANKSIVDYLMDYGMLGDEDAIKQSIPCTIKLHHYVEFRLILRRLQIKIMQELDRKDDAENPWSELVDGEKLYEGTTMGCYGFWKDKKQEPDERRKLETLLKNAAEEKRKETSQSEHSNDPDDRSQDDNGEVLPYPGTSSSTELEEGLKPDVLPSENTEDEEAHDIDVLSFLRKIGLPQYVDNFAKEEITGELLLDEDTNSVLDVLKEVEVTNPLHQMKIMELFRREVSKIEVKYSNDHLTEFLQKNKLEQYVTVLKENGIDGDMILNVRKDLMEKVLKELGITKAVHVNKIVKTYKVDTKKKK